MHGPHAGKSVLIIDQGFLKSRHGKPVHGVELFRLHLVRQLLERGVRVTFAVDPSWKPALREHLGEHQPDLLITPLVGVTPNAIFAVVAAWLRGHRKTDAVLLGNICRGLLPAAWLMKALRLGRRRLAMAHRPPRGSGRGARLTASVDMDILAVSEYVAAFYRAAGDPKRVRVYYGIPNADRFHPKSDEQRDESSNDDVSSPCRFILLGRLPNASKGADVALEAFESLPESVRARCELHLVAYIHEPPAHPAGVVAHQWTPSNRVPDQLREMDVMLALSSDETFSQAIVQGMLTGLPIVATSLPVYVEKMDTGAGIVADEPQAIAEAMERLLQDADLRRAMGAEGRRVALERYVWDTDRFLDEHLFRDAARSGSTSGQ